MNEKLNIEFEWDEHKSHENVLKHGITSEEAKFAFYDDNAVLIYDDEHSDYEDRFVLLGKTFEQKELVVCHCIREKFGKEIIRIISARLANIHERRVYYER